MFVTSSYDGIVRLWDSGSGLCLKSMVPGESRDDRVFNVTSACFSPNGKYILAGTMDNTIRLWRRIRKVCVRLQMAIKTSTTQIFVVFVNQTGKKS